MRSWICSLIHLNLGVRRNGCLITGKVGLKVLGSIVIKNQRGSGKSTKLKTPSDTMWLVAYADQY
jgi:hypothetical protein